jgi:hypothetical protein
MEFFDGITIHFDFSKIDRDIINQAVCNIVEDKDFEIKYEEFYGSFTMSMSDNILEIFIDYPAIEMSISIKKDWNDNIKDKVMDIINEM